MPSIFISDPTIHGFKDAAGDMKGGYKKWIMQKSMDSLALLQLLSEIEKKSHITTSLLEDFDTFGDHRRHNLGLTLAVCHVAGPRYWEAKLQEIDRDRLDILVGPDAGKTSSSIKVFGIKLYNKLSPLAANEKERAVAELQMKTASRVVYKYLSILNQILADDDIHASYKAKGLTAQDFVLNVLYHKHGMSMLHIAALAQDDQLTYNLLILLNKIITKHNAVKVLQLLTEKLGLIEGDYKEFFNHNIGHCIGKYAYRLPYAIKQLFELFNTLLENGCTEFHLRTLLTTPAQDVQSENLNTFVDKFWELLPQSTQELVTQLRHRLDIDAACRHDYAVTPVQVPRVFVPQMPAPSFLYAPSCAAPSIAMTVIPPPPPIESHHSTIAVRHR